MAHGSTRIPLHEDDADALSILMAAAHAQYYLLPARVSFDVLHALAVLCDKYDMAHVLRPWPMLWTDQLARFTCCARVLAIAWVFGLNRIFAGATREFIRRWKPEEDPGREIHIVPDALVGAFALTVPVLHRLRPETAAIGAARTAVIAGIFELCQDRVAEYNAAACEGLDTCTALRDPETCDALQWTTLIQHLTHLGFHPLQRNPETRSIDEILADFAVPSTVAVDGSHAACCAIRRVDEDVRDLVDDAAGLSLVDFVRHGVDWTPDYGGGMCGTMRWPFGGDGADSLADYYD